MPMGVLERIKRKTTFTTDGHFLFRGKKTGRGYGEIWYNGKSVRIGRLICHLYHGMDLNSNLEACHKDICNMASCWNPDHLYVGSRQQNVKDQIRLGRFHFGTKNLLNNRRRKCPQ